jgi:hypothetical protein
MDKGHQLGWRTDNIRKMVQEKKITSQEAEKLIQATKDSLRKENEK